MKPTSDATRSGGASSARSAGVRRVVTYARVSIPRKKWVAKQRAIRDERNAQR